MRCRLVVDDCGESNAPRTVVAHVIGLELRSCHVVANGDESRVAFLGVPKLQTSADTDIGTIGENKFDDFF